MKSYAKKKKKNYTHTSKLKRRTFVRKRQKNEHFEFHNYNEVIERPTFIDLFAGCGGLSLGLMQAGWKGLFAVEKNREAFCTLKENLVAGYVDEHNPLKKKGVLFDWPKEYLGEPSEHLIEDFLEPDTSPLDYRKAKTYLEIIGRNGAVDLLAGGPPCQGFSSAGKRNENDQRNQLYKKYISFVQLVAPKFLLIENVKGISLAFEKSNKDSKEINNRPYSKIIEEELRNIGYETRWFPVDSYKYGVPQLRPRYILLGVKINRTVSISGYPIDVAIKIIDRFEEMLESYGERRSYFEDVLGIKDVDIEKGVTVFEAIGDLSNGSDGPEDYRPKDCDFTGDEVLKSPYRGYFQLRYDPKFKGVTDYQKLMRKELGCKEANSRRMARHGKETSRKFALMQEMNLDGSIEAGRNLSDSDKQKLKQRLLESGLSSGGLKKHAVVILSPKKPSHTLTTLPDDLLHYSEPRILTARECARLQSFPDWFDFKGKYTTGGHRRKEECPRYTQIGNAVPPLLSQFIGRILIKIRSEFKPG